MSLNSPRPFRNVNLVSQIGLSDTRITREFHQIYQLKDLFLYYHSRLHFPPPTFLMLAKSLSMLLRPMKGDMYYKHSSKQLKLPHHVQARKATHVLVSNLRNHATTNPLIFLYRLMPVTRSDHPATVGRTILTLRMYKTRGKVARQWRSLLRLGRSHHILRQAMSHPIPSNLYPIICHLLLLRATRSRRETHMRKVCVENYSSPLIFNSVPRFTDEESRNILRSPQFVKAEEADDFLSSLLSIKKEKGTYIKPEGIHYPNKFLNTFL